LKYVTDFERVGKRVGWVEPIETQQFQPFYMFIPWWLPRILGCWQCWVNKGVVVGREILVGWNLTYEVGYHLSSLMSSGQKAL